jgi:outer membrane lipoprotein-sorting protein
MMKTNESTHRLNEDWEPPFDLAFRLVAAESFSNEALERVKNRAKTLIDAKENLPTADPVSETKEVLGYRASQRMTVLSVAALLFLVFGSFLAYSPMQNQAYAQMVARMSKLKSFVCQIRQVDESKLGELESVPKQELSYKAPSFYRFTQISGETQILDLATSQSVVLDSSRKEAMRSKTSLQDLESPASFVEKLRSRFQTDRKSVEELGTRTIEGKHAVGFRSDMNGDVVEAWLDPQSNLPLEIRMHSPAVDGIPVNEKAATKWTIVSGFEYDVPVDDALFDVAIPSGYSEVRLLTSAKQELRNRFDRFTMMLRECALRSDSVFPISLERTELFKIVSKYSLEWSEKRDGATNFEEQKKVSLDQVDAVTKFANLISDGMDFLALRREPKVGDALDFQYFPGARLNDADRPVAWFSPDGHQTYRVLYADMSIRDVKRESLPSRP